MIVLAVAVLAVALGGFGARADSGAAPQAVAQPEEPQGNAPEQIIVKYRDGLSGQPVGRVVAAIASKFGRSVSFVRTMATGADVVRVDGSRLGQAVLANLAALIAKDQRVEYAEVDRVLRADLSPNDASYSSQWNLFETTGGARLPAAWDVSTGTGVVIGVVDTGYRPHADLAANIVGGYDFVTSVTTANDGNGRDSDARDPGDWCGSSSSSWHGTHVAGIAGAVTNNAAGVAGVAFGARILPLRALGKCGGNVSDIADALIWGSGGTVSGVPANPNPARVVNMSLGGAGSCSSTEQAAINSARSRNTVVVVTAGNSSGSASNQSPANCSGVVVVASTDRNGNKSSFSNYGSIVDLAAPGGGGSGGGILSTLNTGTTGPGADSYAYYQGTSMAAPHVSGTAALMLARTPGLTPDQVESILKSTARAFPGTCNQCGAGIVDAAAAVGSTTNPPPPTTAPPTTAPAGNVLTKGVARTGLAGAQGSQTFFTMAVPAGSTNLTFTISGGTGDADLYVRYGTAPTTSTYNCRPFLAANNESCSFASPQSGTWHVMLRGYSSYSGVSLVGNYANTSTTAPPTTAPPTTVPPTTVPPTTVPPTTVPPTTVSPTTVPPTTAPAGNALTRGVARTGLAGAQGSQTFFTLTVPPGATNLTFTISGGSGDADLYVRFGAAPTLTAYNCRPYRNGNNETCSFAAPSAGTWHVMLRGYSSYSGVSLLANHG